MSTDSARDDAVYDLLSELAGIDTHDVNLRDHPGAWEAVETFVAKFAIPSADQATQPAEAVAWISPTEFKNLQVARECNDHRGFIVRPSREPDMIPSIPLFTHPTPASASEPADLDPIDPPDAAPGEISSIAQRLGASAIVAGAGEALKEKLTDTIATALSGTYHCTRVWEAWHVGTMSEDDFEPVDESDTPTEIADAVLAALGARPVADGEADLPPLPEHRATTVGIGRVWSVEDMRAYARAALARQAPAPLSQAVPEGFWLAPMEPDTEMIRAGHYWEVDERVREFWNALRDHWLSRHPQPQPWTEDARDGERLIRERDQAFEARDAAIERANFMLGATREAQAFAAAAQDDTRRLDFCEQHIVGIECVGSPGWMVFGTDCGDGQTLREAIDAARRAQTGSGKGAE